MSDARALPSPVGHTHVFLGAGHERERAAHLGGDLALRRDDGRLRSSAACCSARSRWSPTACTCRTHAGALLLAALAYTYARRHADDPRFTFGTGKLGDLAGFTSAIVLAMIALLIGWEAVTRFLHPVPIRFGEAIPIACLGLAVNVASAWLLSGGDHHHHGMGMGMGTRMATAMRTITAMTMTRRHGDRDDVGRGPGERLRGRRPAALPRRARGRRPARSCRGRDRDHSARRRAPELPLRRTRRLRGVDRGDPGAARLHRPGVASAARPTPWSSPSTTTARTHRDNNMRSAIIHVLADATVSVLVIVGLVLARAFGWLWMDPLAGIVGAFVIASWSYGLVRDTGAILLDMNPDRRLTDQIRQTVEASGDAVGDLHLWRLGPGHLGAIVSIATSSGRDEAHYRAKLSRFPALSHITVEIVRAREWTNAA